MQQCPTITQAAHNARRNGAPQNTISNTAIPADTLFTTLKKLSQQRQWMTKQQVTPIYWPENPTELDCF